MKHPIFLAVLLANAGVLPALASTPPEVPHQRTWQAFAPFLFSFSDNGESVLTGGGPACQAYSNANYFHQDVPPVSGVATTAGVGQFLSALQKPSGIFLFDSHGGTDGSVALEAFPADDVEGQLAAFRALTAYNNAFHGLIDPNDLFVTRVLEEPQYWVIGARASLIQDLTAERGIVYGTNCFGNVTASAFTSGGRTRDYLGFSAQSYSGSLFFQNDGAAVAQVIFNNMSGISGDGGVFANIPMTAAVPLAQSLVSGITPTYDTSRSPDPRNMRLYNAPRLVISNVDQDIAGDNSFSRSLYHYQFDTAYPYNPGDNSPYPVSPGVSDDAKKGPIKITLRFSEPMDPNWSNFQVQIKFADDAILNVPCSNSGGACWDSVSLPNDTWTSIITLPKSAGHSGKAVVAVRARKVLCGGLDEHNQELDTSGSGSSNVGTYDLTTSFNFDGTGPQVNIRDSKDDVQPNGASSGQGISIVADDRRVGGGGDPPIVSGLAKIEIWKGDPTSGGQLLASNGSVFAEMHTYTSADAGLSILSALPEGQIFVRAIDGAGNDTSVSFNVDRTHPRMDITSPNGSETDQPVGESIDGENVKVFADDAHSPGGQSATVVSGLAKLVIYLNGVHPANIIGSNSTEYPTSHQYTSSDSGLSVLELLPSGQITIVVTDKAGNATSQTFMVLGDSPRVQIFKQPGRTRIYPESYSNAASIEVDATDNEEGIKSVALTGYETEQFNAEQNVAVTFDDPDDGEYTLTVIDFADHATITTFNIDRRKPSISLPGGGIVSGGVTFYAGGNFRLEATDDAETDSGIAVVQLDGPVQFDPVICDGESVVGVTFDGLTEGVYTAYTRDLAGNEKTRQFTVREFGPAVSVSDSVELTADSGDGYANVFKSYRGPAAETPSTVLPASGFTRYPISFRVNDPTGISSFELKGPNGLTYPSTLAEGVLSYSGLWMMEKVDNIQPPFPVGDYVLTTTNGLGVTTEATFKVANISAFIQSLTGSYSSTTHQCDWNLTVGMTATLGLSELDEFILASGPDGELLMNRWDVSGGSDQFEFSGSMTEEFGNCGSVQGEILDNDGNSLRFGYLVFPGNITTGQHGGLFAESLSGTRFHTGTYSAPVQLGLGVTVENLTTDGNWYLDLSVGPALRTQPGWEPVTGFSYFIEGFHTLTELPTLTLPFPQPSITSEQHANLRMGLMDLGGRTKTIPVSEAGSFLRVESGDNAAYTPIVPVFSHPLILRSGGAELLVDGSKVPGASLAVVNGGDSVATGLQQQASQLGYNLQGSLYLAGPEGTSFHPHAYLTLPGQGDNQSGRQIVELSQGRTPRVMPAQYYGDAHYISTEVDQINSYYGIFTFNPGGNGGGPGGGGGSGSTGPVAGISFNGFSASTPNAAGFITEASSVVFTATETGDSSATLRVYYAVDPPSSLIANGLTDASTPFFTLYSSPFSLTAGQRVFAYGAADSQGRYEVLKTTTVVVVANDGSFSTSPLTTVGFFGFHASTPNAAAYIDTTSSVALTATEFGASPGSLRIFYSLDPPSSLIANGLTAVSTPYFTSYVSPFTVGQGTHLLAYGSSDSQGHYEVLKTTAIIVAPSGNSSGDFDPPTTNLQFDGRVQTIPNYVAAIYDTTVVRLNSNDGQSGVARILYALDPSAAVLAAGLHANTEASFQRYTAGLNLSVGDHVIAYGAVDNAGNYEILHSTGIKVEQQPSGGGGGGDSGGRGLGVDSSQNIWAATKSDGMFLARYDANGVFSSSVALEGGESDIAWSIVFDGAGRTYAIGGVESSGSGEDIGIFKASVSGDSIESRLLFDGGRNNNDIPFEAKDSGWITGATQLTGPVSFDAEGDRSFAMALWKFNPTAGTVSVSTTAARAGFDVGAGVAVDPDGSIWVAGFSYEPSAPENRGFDLALWHYAADGHTALAPPVYLPGYVSQIDSGMVARVHATASSVFVTAPHESAASGFDLAFVRYDKASARVAVEEVFRGGDNTATYPAALLPGATTLLIAGGAGMEEANAVLWTFGLDGSLLAAGYAADAGAAKGAAYRGGELWLSVEGSSIPYLVSGLQAAPGVVVDISTPSVSASYAVSPATGPIGIPFTIAGSGFGVYGGGNTRVKFGSATAPLSVWNDTTISGSVPGLSTGAYTVTIERQNASSVTATSAGTFTVTDLSSAALSASAGPIGSPFTFTGIHFGPYGGGQTRVTVGGVAAPLSVWNDTTISGSIPGVSPGTRTVVIERATGDGGLISSAGFVYTVTVPSITSVRPSSGPIGASFTLNGASFGAYGGGLTQVFVGGASAPLSVWNDAQIVGTIPGALAPGVQAVVVERRSSDGGLIRSDTAYFTVTGLTASFITPSSGPIGVPFTISGTSFGEYAGGNTRVRFGAALAALSVWNDTTISGTVPALDTAAYAVVVERQQGSDVASVSAGTFTVTPLVVTSVSPSSGPIGTSFTLTGPGFGTYGGGNTVVLVGGTTAALSVWNDAQIIGTVPGSLSNGAQTVVVRRVSGTGVSDSPAASFTVTGMNIASIAPGSGPIGAPFTITGTQFGAYGGGSTRVKFNGIEAALSLWNDTTISGSVPALATGAVSVVVERQQGSDVATSNISSFTVVAPAGGAPVPSSGPIGVPFTITGTGFGAYGGGNTRVLFAGVAAPLSVWNDTTISGSVPDLPPGSQPVWIERLAGTGVQSSGTSYFLVTVPAVASLTPSSAPIGAPFTITGTSFGGYGGGNTRVKIGGVAAPLSVWNDTQISGSVPGSLTSGSYELVVEIAAGSGLSSSATQAFTVVAPVISSITPASGPTGTVVTLTGTGFGPYGGGLTKVLVGGATVPLSVWNDTTINWTVPAYFSDGDYPVVVVREPSGGSVTSSSVAYTVGSGYGGLSLRLAVVTPLAQKPDSHFAGDLSLSSTTGGRIDTPAKAAVEVPPNAMAHDTEITLKRLRADGLRADAAEKIKKKAAGEPIEFGPEGTRFTTPVTIELPYDPALVADENAITVHYYNPLRRQWEELPSTVDRARHVVKALTDHFSIYQPMGLAPTTVAQDAFGFRDQYAFPNPSRGGALITFRIQPGLAETVEVRVYDASGRKVHESTDFTFLGAIDDGNGKGAQDTYDHAWSVGGVGSGVYTYVIKASAGGNKPIVKSGKVGVIR